MGRLLDPLEKQHGSALARAAREVLSVKEYNALRPKRGYRGERWRASLQFDDIIIGATPEQNYVADDIVGEPITFEL